MKAREFALFARVGETRASSSSILPSSLPRAINCDGGKEKKKEKKDQSTIYLSRRENDDIQTLGWETEVGSTTTTGTLPSLRRRAFLVLLLFFLSHPFPSPR